MDANHCMHGMHDTRGRHGMHGTAHLTDTLGTRPFANPQRECVVVDRPGCKRLSRPGCGIGAARLTARRWP